MGWMGMMHEMEEHMPGWNFGDIAYIMGILGIIFGIIIIAVAVMLYTNPTQHELWGALIIVFSVISVISCMGGMGIGLLLRDCRRNIGYTLETRGNKASMKAMAS